MPPSDFPRVLRRARAAGSLLGVPAGLLAGPAPLAAQPAAATGAPTAATPATGAPAFHLAPGDTALAGGPLAVSLTGLAPGAQVEVVAERLHVAGGARAVWQSRAVFAADASGAVALDRTAPSSGSYEGADPLGLLWSMRPTALDTAGRALGRVRFAALAGGREVASATLVVRQSLGDVEVDAVPGFAGAVFAHPRGAARLPVLIVLGGSEGGASTARSVAPRFASRGYAVLGLPYYSPAWGGPPEVPGLPQSFVNIPVDRLEAVRGWLAARAEADTARIGVWGVSKGAEFALIAASRYPWIRATAAIVPTDVVWEGWGGGEGAGRASSFAFGGRALPFVAYVGMDSVQARLARGEATGIRVAHDAGRRASPARAAAARIPVERYQGALLVAGSMADQVWASGPMAQAIAERRAEAGLATEALLFADAGHAISGDGWSPTTGYGPTLGGTPAANARAQRATWAAVLAFFARTLAPNPQETARAR